MEKEEKERERQYETNNNITALKAILLQTLKQSAKEITKKDES